MKIQTLVPVFNWASPDEQERQAQVRNWRRLLEIAAELECPIVNSELSGNPNDPVRSEHAFYLSMQELAPVFEQYGIGFNLEAHPYDFAETNDEAIGIIRGLNLPWVNYVFCAPHAFHLSDGAGDLRRMMGVAGEPAAAPAHRGLLQPQGERGQPVHHQPARCGRPRASAQRNRQRRRRLGRVLLHPAGVNFDGLATVCVFGWEETADDIHRRMLERIKTELKV